MLLLRAVYGSCACPACVGSYLVDSVLAFPGLAGRESPGGDSLSFASPKESKQRKGDPAVCVPSLRYGQPAVLASGGVRANSLHFVSLKQRAALIRLKLRSSAQTEGVGEKPDRNPYDSYSLWEKAGMRASGGRTSVGFWLKKGKTRLQLFTGSNSGSPHPCLLPGGEGVKPNPTPFWLGL